ncbi:MAG: Bax inhibitor-1/YccA family protein [Actinobacteria bacterium]|nr:Bax inhibitor-1/YccA family protein [Actinomycetota bacterium]
MAGNPLLARYEKEAEQNSGSLYAEGTSAYAQAGGAGQAAVVQAAPGGPGAPTAPGGLATPGRRMTIDDVVVKSGISFAILLVFAAIGWNLDGTLQLLAFGSALVAFVLAMVISFKKTASPILVILYSAFEGLFLGAISAWYQSYGEANGNGNLVLQAVSATFVVFFVTLFVYKSGLVRVTAKTRRIFMIMLFSYLGIALLSLVAALFGVGGGWGFYGVGGIGIIISLFAVGLAAFSLVIDFDGIVRMADYGVDEKESWRMAFGLMVSLVWLYLEILRLLAILNRQ